MTQRGLSPQSDQRPPNKPMALSEAVQDAFQGPDKNERRISRGRLSVAELKLNVSSRILFRLMLGVLHVLSLLPDSVLYSFGIVFGYLGYRIDRRRGEIGMRNLAIAFPEREKRERRRILRASYVNLGRCGAEYVRLGGFFYRSLRKRVTYNDHLEYWNEIQQRHSSTGVLV
jgi:lauroyl/myristoyl acyltransferase